MPVVRGNEIGLKVFMPAGKCPTYRWVLLKCGMESGTENGKSSLMLFT